MEPGLLSQAFLFKGQDHYQQVYYQVRNPVNTGIRFIIQRFICFSGPSYPNNERQELRREHSNQWDEPDNHRAQRHVYVTHMQVDI